MEEEEEVRITSRDCKTMTRTSLAGTGGVRREARPNEASSHFYRDILTSVGRAIFGMSLQMQLAWQEREQQPRA